MNENENQTKNTRKSKNCADYSRAVGNWTWLGAIILMSIIVIVVIIQLSLGMLQFGTLFFSVEMIIFAVLLVTSFVFIWGGSNTMEIKAKANCEKENQQLKS